MAVRRPHDYGLPNGATKKHDDPQEISWTPSRPMRRCLATFRKRRIALALAVAWLLYLFFRHMPTDLLPASQRFDPRFGNPIAGTQQVAAREEFDGPVRFFGLAPSLRSFAKEPLDGSNVLFALASAHSASQVVTAACAMAAQNRSRVHLAVMGRDDILFEKVLELNAIDLSDCPVRWHDAQVDFSKQSSPLRLARGVRGSFGHIQRALSLHAVFFDDSKREEDYLRSEIAKAAADLNVAAIKLPSAESWMLGLSGVSLRWWNQIEVDIVIKVLPETAGSLMRLMRSLQSADYGGLPLPRIILDLPPRTDAHILENLERFIWPVGTTPAESRISIRRRVDDNTISRAVASVQVIESFYPVNAESSHVLVLDPAVEVAPNYFQLLFYLVLEYRYSRSAHGLANRLMGVSLLEAAIDSHDQGSLVISQSLHGQAMLFFGDKWAELHEYTSLRLMADPTLSKSVDADRSDETSKVNWMTLATEMMRAQGYVTLFPSVGTQVLPLAAVHRELHDAPGDLLDLPAAVSDLDLSTEDGVLTADSGKSTSAQEPRELSRASLLKMLQHEQNGLDALPLYSYSGKPIQRATLREQASKYAELLSVNVGGCSPSQAERPPGDLGLLFC